MCTIYSRVISLVPCVHHLFSCHFISSVCTIYSRVISLVLCAPFILMSFHWFRAHHLFSCHFISSMHTIYPRVISFFLCTPCIPTSFQSVHAIYSHIISYFFCAPYFHVILLVLCTPFICKSFHDFKFTDFCTTWNHGQLIERSLMTRQLSVEDVSDNNIQRKSYSNPIYNETSRRQFEIISSLKLPLTRVSITWRLSGIS